jgi:hypothetical protein
MPAAAAARGVRRLVLVLVMDSWCAIVVRPP